MVRVSRILLILAAPLWCLGFGVRVDAQPVPAGPPQAAFSLSSSQVFTSAQQPSVFLTFQQLEHLDFRVYRIREAERFFSSLKDPHVLGGPTPIVQQDPTWVERIASWKARHRAYWRDFLRDQFSVSYRRTRSEARERTRLAERRVVRNLTEFAQVPLLNPEQLVVAWREVLPRTREPEARRIPLDLKGTGIYLVEAVADRRRAYTIVAVSDLGLLTKTAPGQVFSWIVNRASGAPQPACDVATLVNGQRQSSQVTDTDGIAQLALDATDPRAALALARCGTEIALADLGGFWLRPSRPELVAYLYTDRPVYRPGHTVNLKGILRWRDRGSLRPFDRAEAEISLADETDKVVFRAQRPVDAFGAVTASFVLPDGAALGMYAVRVTSGDAQASSSFEVQEYRKPEFEVSVTPSSRLVLQGQQARLAVRAQYFFGRPVASARVRYVVRQGYYYSPWRWIGQPDAEAHLAPQFYGGDQIAEGSTVLDAAGTTTIVVPMPQDDQRRDLAIQVEMQVRDESGREVSGQAVLVAPWARLLLAIAADQYVHAPGTPASVRVRAVDYAGQRQPGASIQFILERLTYADGRYEAPEVEAVTSGGGTTDADGLATWTVVLPPTPGDYRVRAETTVDGRLVSAETPVFVPGGAETFFEPRDRLLELIADRATYEPGDMARLALRGEPLTSPVLVTKERESVTWHRVVAPAADGIVEVPIDEQDIGDVWIHVTFVREDRLYQAERRVRVPAAARTLTVSVEPSAPLARPRQPGNITVRVTDAAGLPVRAQVSLGVVDEALYGVRPDSTPDPVEYFHRRGYSQVNTQFSREYSFVGYSGDEPILLAQRRRPLALSDFKAERPERAEVRRDFPDAILWVADLLTDGSGTATVPVTYPDALTTWRVTARALTADTKVGKAVGRTTVTKDIILRLASPRFLTEGDVLDLPVIAHNYHPEAQALDLQVSAGGLTPLASPGTVRATVSPAGLHASSWRFRADVAGRATLTGSAVATGDGDRLEVTLPVLPFGLRREIGASGSSTAATEEAVSLEVPERSNPAARGVEVTLSPTLAGSLLGALDSLISYPYGCTEQVLSSFLPNLLVLRAFDQLKLAPPERLASLDRLSAQGVRRLLEYQHDSGGWGWWPADQDHPFMTAYALYGLIEADQAGLRVPRDKIEQAARATATLFTEYPRAVPDLKAYLAYALALADTRDIRPVLGERAWSLAATLDELWDARSRMSAYGHALLLLTLQLTHDQRADTLAPALLEAATTTGGLAWWPSDRDPLLGDAVDTSVEATAFALQALAPRYPDHPTLDGALRWLLANRSSGAAWGSTKQTAMALYGLLAVMNARGEQPATFGVDVLINGQVAASRTFTPDSWTAPDPVVIQAAARAGKNDIAIVKRGAGSLYWTATARYYDVQEPIERTGSRTLALKREYFSLAPVTVDRRTVYRTSPFTGTAQPGDLVLVRLTAAGAADWRYLVIDDPLPAGLEAVEDPESIRLERNTSWWTGSRREYRDARVVQFQESFERGRYEYHYLLKAVTPGTFRAMPAQISPMYAPGVSASTTTQAVVVTTPGQPREAGGAR